MPLDGRLWVLTFHRVGDPAEGPPGLLVSPALFERQMRWLAASGRAVGVADVAAARAGSAPLPRDAVLVTFDDAYRDFAEVAWPILRRHGIPATLFVPTAFADGGLRAFWWDRLYAAAPDRSAYRRLREQVKSLPHDRALAFVDEAAAGVPTSCDVLSWAQLRDLAREGVAIGAHTRTHPLLDRLSPERAREEVIGSVEDVRERLGVAPAAFAYPGGAVTDAAVVAAGDAGVGLAFTTEPGVNDVAGADWLRLRRIAVGRRMARPALQLALSPPAARVWTRRAARSTAAPPADRRPAVAYVMSRFPKLSETFVLGEILALERRGVRVEVYPLLRERPAVRHPEADAIAERARYTSFLSPAVVASQLYWLRRRPRAYLGALRDVATGTWGSANFFAGGLAIFPKVAHAARSMRAEGVTHVHCHFANHPAVAGLVISRLTGIPYSFTAHGSDLHVERRMLPRKVTEAAFVVAISEDNRRVILADCGAEHGGKVHVVHTGVDTALFRPRPLRGVRNDPLTVVCVGTLHEVKGQAGLLEACRLLAAEGVDFRCRLIGDGPDRDALARQVAEAGLAERVALVGPMTRGEVAGELIGADVLVAPSVPTRRGKREGIPVVLMEAMASGVPVVASRLSGIPELVEDGVCGLLVPPGDASALAAALRRLAADPALRQSLGDAGRARILSDFDLERSTRELAVRFGLEAAA